LDIEGMEPAVLRFLSRPTSPEVKFVSFEYAGNVWREPLSGVVKDLYAAGYFCFLMTQERLFPVSGPFWDDIYELPMWSNLFCGRDGDPDLEALVQLHSGAVGLWPRMPRTYLAGFAGDDPRPTSLVEARHLCTDLGEACAGVTCEVAVGDESGAPGACTARAGLGGMRVSPGTDVMWSWSQGAKADVPGSAPRHPARGHRRLKAGREPVNSGELLRRGCPAGAARSPKWARSNAQIREKYTRWAEENWCERGSSIFWTTSPSWWKLHKCVLVTVLRTWLRHLGPGDRVLDWGSGCGHKLSWACRFFGLEGLGVELMQPTVVWARRHTLPGTKHCHADGRNLSWVPDGSLDAVISFAALYHLHGSEQCDVVGRLVEKLRPGGKAWLGWMAPYAFYSNLLTRNGPAAPGAHGLCDEGRRHMIPPQAAWEACFQRLRRGMWSRSRVDARFFWKDEWSAFIDPRDRALRRHLKEDLPGYSLFITRSGRKNAAASAPLARQQHQHQQHQQQQPTTNKQQPTKATITKAPINNDNNNQLKPTNKQQPTNAGLLKKSAAAQASAARTVGAHLGRTTTAAATTTTRTTTTTITTTITTILARSSKLEPVAVSRNLVFRGATLTPAVTLAVSWICLRLFSN
ncbi:unnamed protein product, partial [Polarella glacialis]